MGDYNYETIEQILEESYCEVEKKHQDQEEEYAEIGVSKSEEGECQSEQANDDCDQSNCEKFNSQIIQDHIKEIVQLIHSSISDIMDITVSTSLQSLLSYQLSYDIFKLHNRFLVYYH